MTSIALAVFTTLTFLLAALLACSCFFFITHGFPAFSSFLALRGAAFLCL